MQQPYQFTANDADIILRTPEPKLFRVHKNILSIASSVFRDMLAVPKPPSESTKEGERELPVFDVHDSAEDLEVLLRMIYPVAFPAIADLDALSNAFVLLDKYGAEGLQERLKPLLTSSTLLATDPMRVYAIACRWGFKTEAAIAAPHASTVGVSTFTCMGDMRYISGLDYYRIVLLAHERREVGRREILNKPTTCGYCPVAFYDNFRPRLVERLFDGDEMFRDIGTCMVLCFDVVKEMENKHAVASCGYGRSHLEQFIISLAKSLQNIPTSQNTAVSPTPYISNGRALSNEPIQFPLEGGGVSGGNFILTLLLLMIYAVGAVVILIFFCRFIFSLIFH